MSVTTLPQSAVLPTEYQPRTRLWTREEYYRAYDMGLFGPTEKLELIRGEVKEKMPHGPRHASAISLVQDALMFPARLAGAYVRCQLPLFVGEASDPEPDFTVIHGTVRDYQSAHPWAADTLLVGEVSDSTLAYDRSEKARLYAEAQIPEYWILNVVGSYLEVRRDPEDGEYRSLQTLRITASVTPLFAPDTSIAIADLLPQEA
jgi:Uma2 family endonuclease